MNIALLWQPHYTFVVVMGSGNMWPSMSDTFKEQEARMFEGVQAWLLIIGTHCTLFSPHWLNQLLQGQLFVLRFARLVLFFVTINSRESLDYEIIAVCVFLWRLNTQNPAGGVWVQEQPRVTHSPARSSGVSLRPHSLSSQSVVNTVLRCTLRACRTVQKLVKV